MNSLEDNIVFEQEAIQLSYYVYKIYFKHKISIHANCFRSRFSKKDIQYLKRERGW